jgi:hypothetical protein
VTRAGPALPVQCVLEGAQPFRTRTGLCRHSNRSLSGTGNSAGKEFGEARDWGANFGDNGRFRATETAPSRVSDGKAAESQRLFRRRQENGIAQDCVVADALHRDQSPNPNSLITGKLTGNFLILGAFVRFSFLIGEQIQLVTIKFPTRRNREFSGRNREFF